MGSTTGLLRGIVTAISDTLLEVSGYLMCRVETPNSLYDTDLQVDGLYRWPSAGKLAVRGRVYTYTSLTVTPTTKTLHGIKEWFPYQVLPATGLMEVLKQGDVVYYYGQDFSDLDLVKAGFFVDTATGENLTTLARNVGISRFSWMDDATFRKFLKVAIYLDATTVYALEKVLTAVVGVGNYDVWDSPLDPTDHHKVFVELQATATNVYRGKSFLCGGEEQTRTGPNTVAVGIATTTIQAVYGIYERTVDGFPGERQGEKNLLEATFNGKINSGAPESINTSVSVFEVADEGRSLTLFQTGKPDEVWKIVSYLSPNDVMLGYLNISATVSGGQPNRLSSNYPIFKTWMVGCRIQVTAATNSGNLQDAVIAEVYSETEVRLSSMSGGGWVITDLALEFIIWPALAANPSITFTLLRFTVVGNVITTVSVLPVKVYVDYTTVPSAQALYGPTIDGEAQYPFYLYDDLFQMEELLNSILAAGVHPVVSRK